MEWVERVLLALGGGGVFMALAKAYSLVFDHRHIARREVWQDRRQAKRDEITVLHQTLAELRDERDKSIAELKSDRDLTKNALSDLRSEHTQCLIEQERVKAENRWLKRALLEAEGRLRALDGQIGVLEKLKQEKQERGELEDDSSL